MSDVTQDVKARLAQAIHHVMPVDIGPARSMQYSKIAANNVWETVVEPMLKKLDRLTRLAEASGSAYSNLEHEVDALTVLLDAARRWADGFPGEPGLDFHDAAEVGLYKAVKAYRGGDS